jgi:uncharacterized protein (TIGR01777 family)
MNILIAGGSGFLGRALIKSFISDHNRVWILTRNPNAHPAAGVQAVQWDGRSSEGWGQFDNEMNVVINLAGKTLASWPWTRATKRAFLESRVQPGLALAEAIEKSDRRPEVFIQASGINYYGLSGDLADETTTPGDDFLAQLTVEWEKATRRVEELGVRRVMTRSAPVLARGEGMLPLMARPVQLFAGGPIGNGKQALPWIHLTDWVSAVRLLSRMESAGGAFNLISPVPTSNADFNRALAKALHRPFWIPAPTFLLRSFLGEMSVLITKGRFVQPKRLVESGYRFQFANPEEALVDLYH